MAGAMAVTILKVVNLMVVTVALAIVLMVHMLVLIMVDPVLTV